MIAKRQVLGRAATLLARLRSAGLDTEYLAQELVLTSRQLDDYRTGRRIMPLDRQLCLAAFLIEKIPPLAREGRTLRQQVAAVAAYRSAQTIVHNGPPAAKSR